MDAGAYKRNRDDGFVPANDNCLWVTCTTAPKESGVPDVLFGQPFDTITEDGETLQAKIDDEVARVYVSIVSDGALDQGAPSLSARQEVEEGAKVAA